MPEENETAPDAPRQEPDPLEGVTDHNELYGRFFDEFDAETEERKSKAFDKSDDNPLKDVTNEAELYKQAFASWDTSEGPPEDAFFPSEADSTDFGDYVNANLAEINRVIFRGIPELSHEEEGDFATFLESFRAHDVTTAAERSRNLILMQRRGEDVSGALIQAGLNQIDHRRGHGTTSTDATQAES